METKGKGIMVSTLVFRAFGFGLKVTSEQLSEIHKNVKGIATQTLMQQLTCMGPHRRSYLKTQCLFTAWIMGLAKMDTGCTSKWFFRLRTA
jgi:hypothetical protein